MYKLLICCQIASSFVPTSQPRPPMTCPASVLGEIDTHLLAFDFDSVKDSILDARDSVQDAGNSAVDSVAQVKAAALEQVAATKSNAVDAVLTPINDAKAAFPPEVRSVIPDKVDLPRLSLPGSVDGELAPAGPFAGVKAAFQTAGIGVVLGGLVGAKVGWEARGAATAAENAKDAVAATIEKVKGAAGK